jgi:K+-transporting ATPase ATPase C chain
MGQRTITGLSQNPESNRQPAGSILGHIWASIGVTIVLGIICCGIYPAAIWIIGQTLFPVQANGSLLKKDGTYTTDPALAVGSALLGQSFTAPGYFHPRPSAANNSAGPTFSETGGYDPTSSGGTNYGPLNDELINGATTQPSTTQPETVAFDGVRLRTIHYAIDNGIPFKLYSTAPDGTRSEIPLSKFQDAKGNLQETALIDAFPHQNGPPSTQPTISAGDFAVLIPGDAVTASGSGLDPHISPRNAELQAVRVANARNVAVDKMKTLIAANTDGPDLGFLGDPGVNVLKLNLALDAQYPIPAPPATQPAAAATSQPAVK